MASLKKIICQELTYLNIMCTSPGKWKPLPSSLSEKSLSCPESRVLAVFKGIFTPKQPLFRQKDRGSGLLRQPASPISYISVDETGQNRPIPEFAALSYSGIRGTTNYTLPRCCSSFTTHLGKPYLFVGNRISRGQWIRGEGYKNTSPRTMILSLACLSIISAHLLRSSTSQVPTSRDPWPAKESGCFSSIMGKGNI